MNLRRKAADALDDVGSAATRVETAALVQTLALTLVCLASVMAVMVAVKAMKRYA